MKFGQRPCTIVQGLWPDFGATLKIHKKSNFDLNQVLINTLTLLISLFCPLVRTSFSFWFRLQGKHQSVLKPTNNNNNKLSSLFTFLRKSSRRFFSIFCSLSIFDLISDIRSRDHKPRPLPPYLSPLSSPSR